MPFDHLSEERHERHFAHWTRLLLDKSPELLAMQLAVKHRPGKTSAACLWRNGAYNVCYRVKYHDGFEVIVRFAAFGRTLFRHEKVSNELVVMKYLSKCTTIPVPRVYGVGSAGPGPYIVMDFVGGDSLDRFLKDPSEKDHAVLNPHISERALKRAYREMAKLMLELARPEFTSIGSLVETETGEFVVSKRPFTVNMNELGMSANLPQEVLPTKVFKTAHEYWMSLASQHLSNLQLQRNDAIEDEIDCRKKFIARLLFRKIVKDISQKYDGGPFRLYCDDFRPSNVLVDIQDLRITASIDWEFTYVAPAEFSHVAPWWLLLESPEGWETDLRDFLTRFTPRFHLFLEALRQCEIDEKIAEGQRLSPYMAKSLDNGLFWVCLAARYSSMFDDIFWTFIDEKYHGPFVSLENRVNLLSHEDRVNLDLFVKEKMAQEKGFLDNNYPTDVLLDL